MKTALTCGNSGHDGPYFARLLLDKGYQVVVTSRDAHMSGFDNLDSLGTRTRKQMVSMAMNNFRSVLQTLQQARNWGQLPICEASTAC